MKASISRVFCTLAGLMAVVAAPQPVLADDSEVFLSTTFTSGEAARPNVLFIMDTSGSMEGTVNTYDGTKTFAGPCPTGYVYWSNFSNNGTKPPNCTERRFTDTNNRCRASYVEMVDNKKGTWSGKAQMLNSSGSAWDNLANANRKVECGDDDSKHGDVNANTASTATPNRARNGSSGSRWGTSNLVVWKDEPTVVFYSANYMNWWYGTEEGTRMTRLEVVQKVANELITDLEGVNLGVMRYSQNSWSDDDSAAKGGMVTTPVSELTSTAKTAMKAQINSFTHAGFTPLSETYYEAHQYLTGGAVKYGDTSETNAGGTDTPSVAASRVGNQLSSKTYDSPMDFSCQKTFIVYLTDGLPTQDESASADIETLTGTTCPASGPSAGADPYGEEEDGRCMVNLAEYMYENDMRPGDTVPGKQNITTYVIGFGSDIAASAGYLASIAEAGGGKSYTQTDADGLTTALKEIFSDVKEKANSTFVAPTVAVNAFNRTRNLNSLYVSVFAPTNREHWPGNLKRYRLKNGVIYGAEESPAAVDPNTGFFAEGISDLFGGNKDDGFNAALGGAASQLPAWGARKVYTDIIPGEAMTSDGNRFDVGNGNIAAEDLGLEADDPARDDLIKYTLGYDTKTDGNRLSMGDPMHARPAVAIYGGTEAEPEGLVFVTTNDGMLHAVDMIDGEEKWAFLPSDMLGRLSDLEVDEVTASRQYGIDGDVRVFKYDINGNGIIDGEDRMYAVFGYGRGGSVYYALDVTEPDAPTVLWKKTQTDLPMLGQAWSPPVLTRVNVAGQTDAQKLVIIFGAGYDTDQEGYVYKVDGIGNGVYMLELKTGNVLWSAGGPGTNADWEHPKMNNSIPAEITVLDINSDGYGDRLYFGDMGGRIWRLDFWHGQAAGTLASGGLLATLGAGHLDSPTEEDARRFYYAPDVALVTPRGSAPYLNLAIGSGYRGHPLDMKIRDRFYSIRDYQPFNRRTNTSFHATNWSPVKDTDLIDVTDDVNEAVVDGDAGWKIELREGQGADSSWRGEKVLAEAVTVNGVIFFPTFTPVGTDPDNPCLAATLNRTWAVYLDSARPFGVRDAAIPEGGDPNENVNDPEDRYVKDEQGGIAPGTAVVQSDGKTLCLKGVATHKCVDIGDVTRTFWERRQ